MTLTMRRPIAIAAILALALCQLPYFVASAQTSSLSWGEPEPIGEEMPSAWFPEVHADQYGTVRLIWEAVRDDSDPSVNEANGGALLLSELRDGQWSKPSDIYVKDVLNAARPILASDESYLHLISRSPRPEGRITIQTLSALYYMRAPLASDVTNAQSWTTPVRLTSGPAYWAQIQALGGGRVVVVYNQMIDPISGEGSSSATGETVTALFARYSDDYGATWSQPMRISYSANRVARSSLAVSPVDGTLILAWDEGYDNLTGQGVASGIFIATSSNGGENWVIIGQLDPPQSDERLVSYASRGAVESSTLVATDEFTMLVYRSTTVEDVLLYRISTDQGRTWTAEEQIPGALPREFLTPHNFDKLGLAADGDGRIVLVFVGQDATTESGLSVQAMAFEDGEWSAPQVVAAPEGYPEYPRLVITGGNQISLTYFVRDEAFVEHGNYVIWTVHGRTSAAPADVAPTPTEAQPSASADGTSSAESAEDGDAIAIVPYPTVPGESASVNTSHTPEPPRSSLTGPLATAALLTFGLLVVSVVMFKILKRLTGF